MSGEENKTPQKKTPRKTSKTKNSTRNFQSPKQTSNSSNFYEFETKKFFDDVYNATLDYGCDGLDDIQMILNKKLPDSKNTEIIKESLNKAQDMLTNAINYSVDAFELYVTPNVLELPKGFRKIQDTKVNNESNLSENDENELNEKIIKLRKEINEEYKSLQIIKTKNETLKKELDFFDSNKTNFEKIDKICKEKNVDSLSDLMKKLSVEAKKLNETFQNLQLSQNDKEINEENTSKKKKEIDDFSNTLSSK
eukprot:gene164-4410_t